MRIMVTGRDGQLGRSLAERAALSHSPGSVAPPEWVFVGRDELDLARPESIARAVKSHQPDIIINAAAYTAVDRAEDDLDLAMVVNAVGPARLAELAASRGARFVHISTDYVFDGCKEGFYVETDPIAPQGAYGQSKAAGELRVREVNSAAVIIRTAWVVSPFGNNFVKTMLRLAETQDELRIVADQTGSPTSALDLADGLIAMCRYWQVVPEMGLGLTYHLAGQGEATWADVGREVFRLSAQFGGATAEVREITTDDFATKAVRPANSRLDCGLFRETFGFSMPDWRDSLAPIVKRLVAERKLQ